MGWFDPAVQDYSDPNLSFDEEAASIERARKTADILRKSAMSPIQGKMVGRTFVRANPLQHLNAVLQQYMAGRADQSADANAGALQRAQQERFGQTLEEMPRAGVQTRTITPDVGAGAPSAGSVPGALPFDQATARAQGTSVLPKTVSEVVKPTRQDMLRWAGKLYQLPMARQMGLKLIDDYGTPEKFAAMGHLGAVNQSTGEMIPFEQGLEVEKSKLMMEFSKNEAILADRNLGREQRNQLLAAQQALQLQMKQMDINAQAALRRSMEVKNYAQAGAADAKAASTGTTQVKPLQKWQYESFNGLVDEVKQMEDWMKEFEANKHLYGKGFLGNSRVSAGKFLGGMADENTRKLTELERNRQRFDDLPQRHKMFGATLSTGEKSSWAGASINPGMDPEDIKKFMRDRLDKAKRALKNLPKQWSASHDVSELDNYRAQMGVELDDAPTGAAPGAAPRPAQAPVNLSGAKVIRRN